MDEGLAADSALQLPISYLESYPYPAFIFFTTPDNANPQASTSTSTTPQPPASTSNNPTNPSQTIQPGSPRLPILWQNAKWAQEYGQVGSNVLASSSGVSFEDALDGAQISSVRAWLDEGLEGVGGGKSGSGGAVGPSARGGNAGRSSGTTTVTMDHGGSASGSRTSMERISGGGGIEPARRYGSPIEESPEYRSHRLDPEVAAGEDLGGSVSPEQSQPNRFRRNRSDLGKDSGSAAPTPSLGSVLFEEQVDTPVVEDHHSTLTPDPNEPVPTIEAARQPEQSPSQPVRPKMSSATTGPSRAPTLSSHRQSLASSAGDGRSRSGGALGSLFAAGGSGTMTSHHGTTLTLLVELAHKAYIIDLVKTAHTSRTNTTPGLSERPSSSSSSSTDRSVIIVQSFIREAAPQNASNTSGLGIGGINSRAWSRRAPPRQRFLDSYTVSHVSPFQDPGKRYLAYPEVIAQRKATSDKSRSTAGTGTMSHGTPSQVGTAVTPTALDLDSPRLMEEVEEDEGIGGDAESGIGEDEEAQAETPNAASGAAGHAGAGDDGSLRFGFSIVGGTKQEAVDPLVSARTRSVASQRDEPEARSRRSGPSNASQSVSGVASSRRRGAPHARKTAVEVPLKPTILKLLETIDWSSTPLGPRAEWPQWLRISLSLVLAHPGPACLWLGEEFVMLFNENYVHLAPQGIKSFGATAKEAWSPALYAGLEQVFQSMVTDSFRRDDDLWLLPSPFHFTDCETYHSFMMIKLRVDGKCVGHYNSSNETTSSYLMSRRNRILSEVTRTTALSRTRGEFFAGVSAAVDTPEGTRDIPYMAIYDVRSQGDLEASVNELSLKITDHEIDISLHLESTVGVPDNHPSIPEEKHLKLSRREMRKMGLGLEAAAASKLLGPLSEAGSGSFSSASAEVPRAADWPITEAMTTGRVVFVEDASALIEDFEVRIWDELPKEALVIPIIPKGSRLPTSILIIGVNRRRPFDQEHRDWIELLRSNLSSSMAAVSSLEVETSQKEKAQALTKSMNNFFSSAAHELRAPLTLCVGPISDLAKHVHDHKGRTLLTLATRNVLRLQRLVASLMDYSKLDAGREKATYRLTDVGEATRDVVTAFQSFPSVAQGTVRIRADIDQDPNMDANVWVDPGLWDRIVTNLCSNAVKYTPKGEVLVSLHYSEAACTLSVSDTGVGIPMGDIPYITERFYRVTGSENIAEGSGIGLAYCQELIKLHGGTLQIDSQTAAESSDGSHGSTFQVILPLGYEHLDRAALAFDGDYEHEKTYGRAIIDDAAAWQREQEVESSAGDASEHEGSSSNESKGLDPATLFFNKTQDVILIADDNVDMRHYIASLFSSLATVILAKDGAEALDLARRYFPSLIISDVNMPRMSGTDLLAALRKESSELAFIPVILLSAKAGEDDQVDGLLAGADDYLPKPFKSRELVARVNVQIQIGKKRKQLERLFARRTAELEIISKYSPIGIVRALPDGTLAYVNDAWFDQSGYLPRVLPIEDWGPFCMQEDLPRLLSQWMTFVNDATARQVDLSWRWKNGRFVTSTFVRLSLVNPHLDGFVGCVIDLTYQKQKEREQELMIIEEKRRREAAVAARQQQELLIDVTSHELRNPVSAIIQSSLVVAQDLLTLRSSIQAHMEGKANFTPDENTVRLVDEAIDSMDSIFQCGQSMTSISNDILALGRIQLDTLQVFPIATNLSKEVPKILSIFRTETRKLDIDMELNLGDGVRGVPTIQTDPVRFGQILNNLVTNAIRFTATSAIRKITIGIDVSTTGPGPDDCLMPAVTLPRGTEPLDSPIWIYCQVQDTGPGLAPESLEKLFKRFSQATSETHVHWGGSGLGLFVSRKLCDLLGGKIEISSQFGHGSTFRFVVKAGTSAPSTPPDSIPSAPRAPIKGLRKLRVAIVEDNVINSKILKRQLTGAGHDVEVAFNGLEGLKLMRLDGYRRFDVVIMDIEMPVMDGLTAIRTIRTEEQDSNIPRQQVVALTGNAREAQKEAALAAGYDDVVIKPYKLESLLQVLQKWARGEDEREA